MSYDGVELMTSDEIVSRLLQECALGDTAADDAGSLPSVSGVLAIMDDIRELLFPGIHRTRRPSGGDAVREFHLLFSRVQSMLRIEVGRAMVHSRRAAIRLHGAAGENERGVSDCASEVTDRFLSRLPELRRRLMTDLTAAFDGDPAAKTREEILLCYPGIEAIYVYRVAHELLRLGVPYLPRIMTERAHRETGIDIHPGAEIGECFFIDHGTGVVIGETCVIGQRVTVYQGVTLGAWSFPRDEDGQLIRGAKRHPTLEDDVTVYSNATVLGGTTVIGAGARIGANVSISRSVPARTIVTLEQPSLRFREAG